MAAAALAALGLASILALSCGGGGGGAPSSPSTPTPTAQPTTPPPTDGGSVGSSACSLGSGSPNAQCAKGSARLLDAVLTAQDALVQQKPQIFDKTQENGDGSGQYLVRDKEAYLDGLLSILASTGYCAQRDPEGNARRRWHSWPASWSWPTITTSGELAASCSKVSACR